MDVIKWDPFRGVNRFFDDDFWPRVHSAGWDLAIDIYEEGDNVIAEMNLPGVDPKDVEVSVEDGYLHVRGQRQEEKEDKQKHYYYKEISRGSFERSVRLPATVDGEKAVAESEKGMLKVIIPKKNESKPKKIEIELKDQK